MSQASVQAGISKKHELAAARALALTKSDPQLSALIPDLDLTATGTTDGLTLDRILDTLFEHYKDRPAMGQRRYEAKSASGSSDVSRQYSPAFDEITYGELQRRIHALAMAWRNDPRCRLEADEFIAIMGFSGIDFVTIDYACAFAHTVSVPIQSSTGSHDLKGMLERVEPTVLATSIEDLEFAIERTLEQPSIRTVIVFDFDPRITSEAAALETAQGALDAADRSINIISLNSLIEDNADAGWSFLPPHRDGWNRLNALIHSSGSTGVPKGAMITDRALRSMWLRRHAGIPVVGFGLAPLNHLMARAALISCLRCGGTKYFTLKSDMSTLFEDIRIARPTTITFFPRILELVYQHYQSQVAEQVRNGVEPATAERSVRDEMSKTFLGDRLVASAVGGAPLAPAIHDFVEDCFGIFLSNGYGNTEAGNGMLAMDGIIQSPPVIEYRLRDVPELGYYLTDKPYPRGELCYKTETGIVGYYKQPEATAALFDEDGFSCTGDIVEEREPGYIAVIDRRKDVLKLSQGEYVALGRLGTTFEAKSPFIHQIYLYGTSLTSYLLAVIVPEADQIEKELGAAATEADIKQLLRKELLNVAKIAELKSFEVPRDFIIEPERFSQENGLLSSVRKRLRPALKAKYGPTLDRIYEENERKQTDELEALKDPKASLSTQEKLTRLAALNLGLDGEEISNTRSYAELGGDSLGAVIFSLAIEEVFGVSVPANDVLAPTGNISAWAKSIDEMIELGADALSPYVQVHGEDRTQIRAADLKLSSFIDPGVLDTAKGLARVSEKRQSEHVLITGANGFLGRVTCIDWLKRVADGDGKVICLIRAKNDQDAFDRLEKSFEESGADLLGEFRELSKGRLQVLAGDISDSDFGLDRETYDILAKSVTRIVHIAALVNHVMQYEHMFKPNVCGVAEIIKFAISKQIKPIVFVSSAGVGPFLEADPDSDTGTKLAETITLSDNYAAGYGATKWAGEHLLKAANDAYGMPVHIFRGDMMLAHRIYAGYVNVEDMFTRLLYSIVQTGLAPSSFFSPANAEEKPTYNGTPVDVVSQVITECADVGEQGVATYTISTVGTGFGNSLDDFVQWLIELGCTIEYIPDHQEWVRRFEQKMNAMGDVEKGRSALALMSAYRRPWPADRRALQCPNYSTLVKQLNITNDRLELGKSLIEKYLSDMRLRGLLENLPHTAESGYSENEARATPEYEYQ